MKYSINIKSAPSLKVCVGEFYTFEEAKAQMLKLIIDLIDRQKDDYFDAWENLKEDFSFQVRNILLMYECFGEIDFDDEIDEEGENTSCFADESNFEISGKPDNLGYHLSIDTNVINMYDSNKNYHFTLTRAYDGGDDELTIALLVNDGAVEVYNIIPDDARSCLEPVDLDDE